MHRFPNLHHFRTNRTARFVVCEDERTSHEPSHAPDFAARRWRRSALARARVADARSCSAATLASALDALARRRAVPGSGSRSPASSSRSSARSAPGVSALSRGRRTHLPPQAAARFGVGCLVNSFAPAKLGDAVKIALCARAIDAPDRLWTAGGAYAALAAARSLDARAARRRRRRSPVRSRSGRSPRSSARSWPSRPSRARLGRLRTPPADRSFLGGVRALARSPRPLPRRPRLVVGSQASPASLAPAAVAAALGVPHPLLAALVILPALDLAEPSRSRPDVGIARRRRAGSRDARNRLSQALATGLAIQGVETLVSLACGSSGSLVPRRRRAAASPLTAHASRSSPPSARASLGFARPARPRSVLA